MIAFEACEPPIPVAARGPVNEHEPRTILLIRPSALGDVCRSVAVLSALRARFPSARIDWLVQDSFADAIRAHPALGDPVSGARPKAAELSRSGVVLFPRKRFDRWWSPTVAIEIVRWLERLRSTRYDLVVDAQGLLRSGIFAWCTRAPLRIGARDSAEWAWLGVNRRVEAPQSLHTVERMLKLVEAINGRGATLDDRRVATTPDLRLYTTEADRAFADQALGGSSARAIVIAPTSRWPGKQWPADRYAAVVHELMAAHAAWFDKVVIVGGAGERTQCGPLLELAHSVQMDGRVVDLIGRTTVGQLMAVIQRSRLVLANDSAALHMAVGFDRPLIGLFGPTRVDRVGPYGRERDVIQHVSDSDPMDHKDAQCGSELMARISVKEVLTAAVQRLSSSNGA